jgi:Rrf2 family protein
MLTLSKKVEYGLISLLHMDTLRPGELATAKEMSEIYNIPPDLLGKVLQALVKAEQVQSEHGVKGGYRLRGSIDAITLGDVIAAVEGPVFLARCQHDPSCCDQFKSCNIKAPVFRIQDQLMAFIHGISLGAFRTRARTETLLSDVH